MPFVQFVKLIAILLFLPAHAILGGRVLRRWRRRSPSPNPVTDPEAWTSYWLPKLVAVETWTLAGTAVIYVVLAFVAPTLYGETERIFMLAGAAAFPLFALMFAGIGLYVILNVRRLARRRSLSTDPSLPARS